MFVGKQLLCVGFLCVSAMGMAQQVGESSSTPGPSPLGSTATITVMPGGQTPQDVPEKKKKKEITPGVDLYDRPVRAFSKVGVALKITTLGPGFDVATPLSRSLNLRGSAMFFDYGHDFSTDGISYNGELNFRGGAVSLDWFPLHGGFHVSPGMLILKSDLRGAAFVPGGSTFTLNDVDYTSSVSDPVHGSGGLTFPHTIGPSLTVGWGNIVPRSGKHWSVPFEIGAAYLGQPSVKINLAGTACQGGGCSSVATDPATQQNIRAEQDMLNDDLKGLQVYPIVSLGLSYKF